MDQMKFIFKKNLKIKLKFENMFYKQMISREVIVK